MKDVIEKFNRLVIKNHGKCWSWSGYKNNFGYCMFQLNKKNWLAHRVSWLANNGPIKDGMFVLHKCDNTSCSNPKHLWLGTYKDNIRDCVAKGRNYQSKITHCPSGHEYTKENTYLYSRRRNCRACHSVWRKKIRPEDY